MSHPIFTIIGLVLTLKLSSQPTITSFDPVSGPTGTRVTIKGTQFDPVASHNVVYVGGVKATVSSASDTSVGQTYHPNNCVSDFSATYNFVVTGIIDLGNHQYIRLFPNPVKNYLNVDWYIAGMPGLNIDIADLQGRRMLSSKNLHNATSIDLSRLPQSVYLVRIYTDRLNINYTIEIVKQN